MTDSDLAPDKDTTTPDAQGPAGDPALLALAAALNRLNETLAVVRVQQDLAAHYVSEVRAAQMALDERIARLETALGVGQGAPAVELKFYERRVLTAMAGMRPENRVTEYIARESDYSNRRALDILRGMAAKGVILRTGKTEWALKAEDVA